MSAKTDPPLAMGNTLHVYRDALPIGVITLEGAIEDLADVARFSLGEHGTLTTFWVASGGFEHLSGRLKRGNVRVDILNAAGDYINRRPWAPGDRTLVLDFRRRQESA